jgi:hypothetical protein
MFASTTLLTLILIPLVGLVITIWRRVEKNEMTANKDSENFKLDTYQKRMNWLLGYLIVAIFLFCLWLAFRNKLTTEWGNIIFCLFCNFLGAVLYGSQWRIRSKANPFPAYLAYYPFVIVAFSALTFALTTLTVNVANLSEATIFYGLAFFLGIYCGQHLDNIKELGSTIKRVQH